MRKGKSDVEILVERTYRPDPAFGPSRWRHSQSHPPLAALQTFTIEDLQAALADANAQTPPDTRHAQCWQAAIDFVKNIPESWSRPFEQDSAKAKWTAARVGPLQFRARGVTEGGRSPTGDTSCARRKIHAAAARGDGVK